jgi:hypothetical protein
MGVSVTVHAPGYLTREAAFDGQPFYLWPQEEAYVRVLVYNQYSPGQRLSRWTTGFTVKPLPGREDDSAAVVGAAGAASGLSLSVSASGVVEMVVDPDALSTISSNALAATWRTFRGNTVTGCRVVVRREAWTTRGIMLHELGHCLGLGHSQNESDLMYPYELRVTQSFSEREMVTLRMMYRWRKPGNAAPDHDPGVAGAAFDRRTLVIVD